MGQKRGVFQTIITLVELLARYHPHVSIPAYINIYIPQRVMIRFAFERQGSIYQDRLGIDRREEN